MCEKTVRKWVARHAVEGGAGLWDWRSRPHRLRGPTAPALAEQVLALRRQRWLMKRIAGQLGLSLATVSRLLKRAGLSRLNALEPPVVIQRYEYSAPGELLHFDTTKLAASIGLVRASPVTHQKRSPGAGFEVAHICIDDHSRVALCRSAAQRAQGNHRRLPQPRARPLPDLGGRGRPHHDRQRLVVSFLPYCRPVPQPQAAAHLHSSLHPADQRQGRTLHPNSPLPRAGPMQNPTTTARNAPPHCAIGSTTTTATALISASAAAPLSLAFPRTTCCNSTVRLPRRKQNFRVSRLLHFIKKTFVSPINRKSPKTNPKVDFTSESGPHPIQPPLSQ